MQPLRMATAAHYVLLNEEVVSKTSNYQYTNYRETINELRISSQHTRIMIHNYYTYMYVARLLTSYYMLQYCNLIDSP